MDVLDFLHLPEGYQVRVLEGGRTLGLYDPQDILLLTKPKGRDALAALEEFAWRDAWARIRSEIRREVRDLRRGKRSIDDLKRTRQYLRLVDALQRAPLPEVPEATPVSPRSRGRPASLVTLALAGAAAVTFLVLADQMTPPEPQIGEIRQPAVAPVRTTERPPAPAKPGPALRPPTGRAPRDRVNRVRRVAGVRIRRLRRIVAVAQYPPAAFQRRLRGAARPAAPVHASPILGYGITFGQFTTSKPAYGCARLVRSKGYLARVVQIGDQYRVIGRDYLTRSNAERMAAVFRAIGLPASVIPITG